MTDDPPPLTAELLDEYVRRVELLIRGFGQGEELDKDVFGAPDFYGVALRSSRDFWDDRSTEVWEAADHDIEDARGALIGRLTERWGAPLTLDASPFLFPEQESVAFPEQESVAPVLSHLANWGDAAQAWLLPATEHFLALAVCQSDTEFPLELTAIVGRASDVIDVLTR